MTEPAIDPATWANLVEMTGDDLAFIDELVDTYLDEGSAQIAALRAAADRGTVSELVRPAHSMKSSSLNIGALRLGELCRALEEAARSGSVTGAAAQVDVITSAFDDARRELLAERTRRAPS
jgi:HPt (histidine-containing phosphotransfer) domain-containing protein